jgi:thioredoxin reductase (NADPH)
MKINDVIIVGGGPAGYSAALYCARAGLETLVVEKLSAGGQMATTALVDNYPGFDEGIDGFVLAEKMARGATRFGAQTQYAEVTGIDLMGEPKRVETTDGTLMAKAVILAMGASPRELGLLGEREMRGRGIHYCATCDAMFYKGKTVAVIGGGNTAVADALTLSRMSRKVYIVHRRDQLRATKNYLDPLQKAGNIEIVWNALITGFERTEDGKFAGLALTDKVTGENTRLSCDGAFVAIGRSPDSALVNGQVELGDGGYIVADETTKTNLPGVFAIGDIRTKPLRQIVTAAADGATSSVFAEEYINELK